MKIFPYAEPSRALDHFENATMHLQLCHLRHSGYTHIDIYRTPGESNRFEINTVIEACKDVCKGKTLKSHHYVGDPISDKGM